MIKLDRIKIVFLLNSITNINEKQFISKYKNNHLYSLRFEQKIPFYLLIAINYEKRECIIEFTSKILHLRYGELININNITQCLTNINDLGLCKLNIDDILNYGEVLRCDVTKDLHLERNDFERLIRYARSNIKNYRKWECNDNYRGNGVKIENKVKTISCKKRLVIYDKFQELQNHKNRDFISSLLGHGESFLSSFQNVTRFELNLKSKKIIRDLLHIHDNYLLSVLYSEENPIYTVVNEAFKEYSEKTTIEINNTKDYETSLILKDCGNDLAAVEAKIRSLTPKNTSIKRKMERFREFYDRHFQPQINIRELVA